MDPSRLIPLLAEAASVGAFMWVGVLIMRHFEPTRNAALRREIEAQVCFAAKLDHARVLGTSGLAGTRGRWIPLQRPIRLTVGTNAFMVSAPQALREFVFRGCECSIVFSRAPSRFVDRDWIVVTGQAGGRRVQLAISHTNLLEIWQALAATGAAS